jgi:hypothetical protein
MLVGHHAVGFAAKRFAPDVSLGTLQVACIFPDLLTFVLQLLGVEHARVTPGFTAFSSLDGYDTAISHSLATNVLWSALFGAYFWRRRDLFNACVVGGVVFSHWILDFVSHRPQIALVPGVQRFVGLGLWNSIPATFFIEGALWLAGIAVYLGATRASSPRESRIGSFALASFVCVLTLFWVTTPFAPQPPGDYSRPVLLIALVVYSALLLLAYWTDRRRIVRLPQSASTAATAK